MLLMELLSLHVRVDFVIGPRNDFRYFVNVYLPIYVVVATKALIVRSLLKKFRQSTE